MGRMGGKYVSLEPFSAHAATRKVVKGDWAHGPLIFGEGSTWPDPWARPASQELADFGADLWRLAQRLVEQGKLRHHPLRVLDGGFPSVLRGLELLRSKQVSGEKIVVRI